MRKWIVFSFLLATFAPAQESHSEATFRTGTELVQLSVIAQDQHGKAMADLRREDFQIFDNGAPQKIALFLAPASSPQPESNRTPGVFTNQIATDAGAGYSVLLFDNLNVDPGMDVFAHTSRARQKALKAMMAIPPGDKIAIYSLWCQFQVFREFTTDRDLLLQQLEKFAPAAGSCVEGGNGPQHALTERIFIPQGTPAPLAPVGLAVPPTAGQEFAAAGASITADISDIQIKQLAEHLAGIPGRKNLIWLTTMFRLKPSNLQKLINANVAIYPVDTIGSTIGLPRDKELHAAPIRALAAMTGGVAYVDRDDLDVAIGEALNDGHISYTLGFYRPDESRNEAVHRIVVKTSHEDVVLRYRASYSVEAPQPKGSSSPVQVLVDAINRPVDATAIAITALPTRNGNRLNLALSVDVSALDLQQRNGFWEGKAEFVARFLGNDAKIAGQVITLTMSLHLRPATYAAALQHGFQFRREIEIPPKSVDLNLLVGNLASGKIGTLTIPLSEVKSDKSGAVAEK